MLRTAVRRRGDCGMRGSMYVAHVRALSSLSTLRSSSSSGTLSTNINLTSDRSRSGPSWLSGRDRSFHRNFCGPATTPEEAKEAEMPMPEVKPVMNESVSGEKKTHSFQTETKQLLDIVTNSLYTDREVFLRELLSNASDALEKLRYTVNSTADGSSGDSVSSPHLPMQIEVYTDVENGQIIIQDSGIGMDDEELASNLGTIARSGSKAFVRQVNAAKETSETDESGTDAEKKKKRGRPPKKSPEVQEFEDNFVSGTSSIIGQFGVGFYSVFMVADKVDVYSKPARTDDGETGFYWTSDGTGEFEIAPAKGVQRGTKVVIHLSDKYRTEFSDRNRIERIIKKYSSYLLFPIKLNGSLVTSTGAIWAKQPSEVRNYEHNEFFQLISNRYDDPLYTYHSHFDSARFTAQCLAYFPSTHEEKFGAGRLQPGVSLYCKKVLVKRNAPEIVPDWLRFVKGVVDSEDIPIHISRENMQDSNLISQLKETLTMKIVDYLKRQSSSNPKKYLDWYNEYCGFIKEGVCTDYKNRSRIARLLRYETNLMEPGQKIGLDEYIERRNKSRNNDQSSSESDSSVTDLPKYENVFESTKDVEKLKAQSPVSKGGTANNNKPDNNEEEIYYLLAPNRETALKSPYMEAFEDSNIEVLFCYAQIDEFCMKNLGSYHSHEIVGIESSTAVKSASIDKDTNTLTEEECRRLCKWLKKMFPKRVEKAEMTQRLKRHAAVLVDHQSQAIRSYLQSLGEEVKTPPQRVQINPRHKVIRGLYPLIEEDELKAKLIANQLLNNAFMSAGIVDDPRDMVDDISHVMEMALGYSVDACDIRKETYDKLDEKVQEMVQKEQAKLDHMDNEFEDDFVKPK